MDSKIHDAAAAGQLAVRLCRLDEWDARRIERLIAAYGLPVRLREQLAVEDLLQAMRLDKKVAGNKIRLVLPTKLGAVTMRDDIEVEAIHEAWKVVRA